MLTESALRRAMEQNRKYGETGKHYFGRGSEPADPALRRVFHKNNHVATSTGSETTDQPSVQPTEPTPK